ncbi:hypothetical protein MTO96_021116 [Rhipicephalus appendiculatus]
MSNECIGTKRAGDAYDVTLTPRDAIHSNTGFRTAASSCPRTPQVYHENFVDYAHDSRAKHGAPMIQEVVQQEPQSMANPHQGIVVEVQPTSSSEQWALVISEENSMPIVVPSLRLLECGSHSENRSDMTGVSTTIVRSRSGHLSDTTVQMRSPSARLPPEKKRGKGPGKRRHSVDVLWQLLRH